MYRKVILFILVAFVCVSGFSQESRKRWQIEPYIGGIFPLAGVEEMHNIPFVVAGLGYRHSLSDDIYWIGAELSVQSAARVYSIPREEYQSTSVGCRTISLCVVGEVHFLVRNKFRLYGGIGAGAAQCLSSKIELTPQEPFRPMIKPYFGIECWQHLRAGVEVMLTSKYYNSVNLRIGYAF